MASVRHSIGTAGSAKAGRASGRRPRSAIVRSGIGNATLTAVSTTMQISGDGMTVVTRGVR